MADECVKFCYARKGAYIWSNVNKAHEERYEFSKTDEFVPSMINEIKRKKADYVRIHDSGDYYSKAYLNKWLEIMNALPEVRFYSYTNMIDIIQKADRPENFDVIFSDSGKQKHLINQRKHRHTAIFKTSSDLLSAGYVNASEYDLLATKWFSPKNHNIGLVFH